ncbi:MAG: tRNA (N6-isopentenyl adenosine(37)-C2)-methylthiotransferase MiaB [Candidatus Ancillula sp.]|jgi:tRNA-2-methylthio-N6-dimethylallyladenosine synthase|nr:tRNA (N6-isopentenyl adenosine(37)-C2)-methylthiotransferase MiaB [Candidatus Ancillula sp.]
MKKQGYYYVETLGCQMNAHDSERIAGVLEEMGYKPCSEEEALEGKADIFAINTCAVRENASNKLYGHVSQLWEIKRKNNPDMIIAVGGCLAQKDKENMVKRAPDVDVVFGTYNLQGLPKLIKKAQKTRKAQVEILPRLVQFPSELSAARQSKHSAWISISMGCNNTCTYCIVPSLRGRERDRRIGDVLSEVEEVVANGAKEITFLGQNVNTYGSEFGDRGLFAKLLRKMADYEKDGLKRVRFTSPHPAAFTEDVVLAMAETPNVMPSLHMPLQSGSDKVLREMRRSYKSERFLNILKMVRQNIPDAAVTTDIIVGFPGETEEDFQETLRVVEEARFASAYTFQYSIRPGTLAGAREDQIPKEIVQERFERLLELQNKITLEQQKTFEGKTVEVMVNSNHGRKDNQQKELTLSGYTRDARLTHFVVSEGTKLIPGDLVNVEVNHAAPYHLVGTLK